MLQGQLVCTVDNDNCTSLRRVIDSLMTLISLFGFCFPPFVYYCHGDETKHQASGERFSASVHVWNAHNRVLSVFGSSDVL